MLAATVVAALVAGAFAGCSGDDDGDGGGGGGVLSGGGGPAGDDLVAPFEAAAEDAYEAAGSDRVDDHARGVLLEDGCIGLDDRGAVAVAEALGLDGAGDAVVDDSGFLTGTPGQSEVATCGIDAGDDRRIGVNLGTTVLEPDEVLEAVELSAEQNDEDVTVLDGGAPGLDGDSVVAVAFDEHTNVAWVDGDFQVVLVVPASIAGPEEAREALPVLVGAVADALGVG